MPIIYDQLTRDKIFTGTQLYNWVYEHSLLKSSYSMLNNFSLYSILMMDPTLHISIGIFTFSIKHSGRNSCTANLLNISSNHPYDTGLSIKLWNSTSPIGLVFKLKKLIIYELFWFKLVKHINSVVRKLNAKVICLLSSSCIVISV